MELSDAQVLSQYFESLLRSRFFGTVTIQVENGAVVLITEQRKWKVKDLV